MGIKTMEQAGLEADDILGTLAKRAEKEGMDVSLVSGDRDLLQIATDKIKIRIPKTKGARTEVEDYYAADVEEKYGVTPAGFIELKALMGDTADNIPGVPKVGEKTAAELLKQFSTLDNLYAHVEEVTKKAVRESLIANRDLAYLSLTLATINVDSPVELAWEEARLKAVSYTHLWKHKRRPVLINNWEGTYFDFTGDKLVSIAAEAAKLGVELFVMDDGWFGKRDSDNSGLGDWYPNEEKLGCTLGELGARIEALGMKFGIWFEPECISEDSSLYRCLLYTSRCV